MISVNTNFVERLKEHDDDAWFELWEVFGASIERMVESLTSRFFSPETVKDIRQETLLQVFGEIRRFDSRRGVKFSTWLYAIAKHIVASELTYRNAQKRGGGVRPLSLDEIAERRGKDLSPPEEFENEVFRAKVYRAMEIVQRESDFLEFQVYKMRISRKMKSTEIAAALGVSEASVSRYIRKIRGRLQQTLRDVVREYSWTEDEVDQIGRHRLDAADHEFDGALGDIYARVEQDKKRYSRLGKTARGIH